MRDRLRTTKPKAYLADKNPCCSEDSRRVSLCCGIAGASLDQNGECSLCLFVCVFEGCKIRERDQVEHMISFQTGRLADRCGAQEMRMRLTADVASVRFGAAVDVKVARQVAALQERFAADVALETLTILPDGGGRGELVWLFDQLACELKLLALLF